MECHQSQPRNFLGRGDLCLPNDRSGTIGTSFGLLGILCARTHGTRKIDTLRKGQLETFIHNTPRRKRSHQAQDIRKSQPRTGHTREPDPTHNETPRTRHTLASFKCSRTCNAYRAHRHGSESPYPGSTPGLNPCNHLTWLVGGPWRTHIQAWYGMVWYGMAWDWTRGQASSSSVEERSSLGHHRAEGAEAVVAEAGAAGGRRGSLPLGRWPIVWERRHQW